MAMLVSSVPFDHHDGLGKTSYGADRIKDTRHPVPESDVSTSMARHSRVKSSTMLSVLIRRPLSNVS